MSNFLDRVNDKRVSMGGVPLKLTNTMNKKIFGFQQ